MTNIQGSTVPPFTPEDLLPNVQETWDKNQPLPQGTWNPPVPTKLNAAAAAAKIHVLSEAEKMQRREAYARFQKLALVKAKLIGEAILDLKELGFDESDMMIETNKETWDEFLKLDGKAVFKVEPQREAPEDGSIQTHATVITGVKGYWLQKIIEPKKIVTVTT